MVGVSRQHAGVADPVPVRLVCRRTTVADADCAYDPHPPPAVYPEPRRLAADADDAAGDGGWHCAAVLAAGKLFTAPGAAAELLPVADRDSGGVYDADATGERNL